MGQGTWHSVGAVASFEEDSVTGIDCGDRKIAIYRVGSDEFFATDNICTHEYALLSDGWLDGYSVECPLHAGCFDVRNGAAQCAPLERDVRTFPIRVEGNDVLVMLDQPDAGR